MHVLHIYKDYYPVVGGIEGHIQVLAEGLVRQGHQATVLVTNTTAETLIEDEQGVQVIRTARDLHMASTPFSIGMAIMARTIKANIVDLHMPYPPGDIVARAVPGRPPLVVSYHSDVVRQQRLLRIYRPVLERTLRHATRIVATSKPYIDSSPFLRPHAAKCRVVPYGIDVQRFATFDGEQVGDIRRRWPGPLLLTVGVLRYYKGLHFLIEAMQQVEATLLIVGAGPEEAALREATARLGLHERVFFVGGMANRDLPAYYHAADLFVLPSHLRSEAFGIVLLEAMAAGLPLVTTELGTGTSFINQHGRTGFVVPPANPQSLARAISVLVANPDLRARFGQAGRREVLTNYTPEHMVGRMLDVYRECLATPQGSTSP